MGRQGQILTNGQSRRERAELCICNATEKSEPTRLVVPTSLQMGWVESPPYFCAATETSRDIATRYCDTKIGSMPAHKFEHYVMGSPELQSLDDTDSAMELRYALEVYVDDFMAIIIPTSRTQVEHVARAIMTAIHDVFPASTIDADDPISEKKMKKGEGTMSTKNHYWALSSMASTKHCGWNQKRGTSSLQPFTNGFVLGHVIGGSPSKNSNQSWQKSVTHSLPYQLQSGSYLEQTQC